MNKRVLAMLLCLVMVLSVMSIGATAYAEDTVPAHKETLVIGTAADINNLNLQKQQDATNNIILKNTHQTLLFFNNDPNAATRFDPGLAGGLQRRGHQLSYEFDTPVFGRGQMIVRLPNGVLVGGTESRTDSNIACF